MRASSFGKDADDVGAPLDVAVDALGRIRAVQLGAMLRREAQIGEQVPLGGIHELCQFGNIRPER